MNNAPCLKCDNRKPGCHGGCEEYRSYRENREAAKKRNNPSWSAGDFLAEQAYKTMRKNGKRK